MGSTGDYSVSGIVPIPAGGSFDTWAVGLGKMDAQYYEKSSRTLSLAATPTLNPSSLSPNLYLYFDINQVWRVGDGVDFGLRLTVAPEAQKLGRITDVLAGKAAPQLSTRGDFLQQRQQARRGQTTDPMTSPLAGQGVDSRPFLSLKAQLTW